MYEGVDKHLFLDKSLENFDETDSNTFRRKSKYRTRYIPIGSNRRRGAPKKLSSGLRYQPSELVESEDEFL